MPNFEKSIALPVSAEELFEWHARRGAFERLAPPYESIEVLHSDHSIRDGSVLIMKLKKGPASVTWKALHKDYVEGRQFVDTQVEGPFKSWTHTHRFEPNRDGSSRLIDRIEYELPVSQISHALALGQTEAQLERMFRFRHRRTRDDLARHALYRDKEPMKIAISGASGLIGTALSSFLSTGGHEVYALVRSRPQDDTEIEWNVREKRIDAAALEGLDAVIHLAGEPIAGRWTDAKKQRIHQSRVDGTRLIAETLAGLKNGPDLLISASAIGYYGDRGSEVITEASEPGKGFLPEVCRAWEAAADPARDAGIRVIHPRIGVVLSPQGGALEQMLTPFKLGAGGVVGDGDQYMSWIALDDIVGAMLHLLQSEEISGPVNLTAPNPVTNREFTKTLGKVLNRPTFMGVPEFAIKLALGEMGENLLLNGARVVPDVLNQSGFSFLHSDLESALRAELAK